MGTTISETITSNGKQLIITAVSFSDLSVPRTTIAVVKEVFEKLAPFMKDDRQFIYIRDMPRLCIDGKYPGGNCYNRHEAMIALPNWEIDEKQLVSTVSHELHHMARWQNAGFGDSLGGSILSEGVATLYEELQSGWTPPWSQASFTQDVLTDALDNWENKNYNHNDWFFRSDKGRWIGYTIGYQLAKKLYKNGFNLENSLNIRPNEVKEIVKTIKQ